MTFFYVILLSYFSFSYFISYSTLLNQLNRVNSDECHLTVVIWGDSFGDFETMRDICRSLKLEYELIVMQPDGQISEGDRSTKPKVQAP